MDEHKDVWIVVPALNEAPALEDVLKGLKKIFANIIVVDDGSSDGTNVIAFDNGAHTLCHANNLGQGAAIKTGLEYALTKGARYLVTFDADGQHHPEDAKKLVESLIDGGFDIVCGSRFLGEKPQNMPLTRKALILFATLVTRWLTGVKVTDAHNGLRAFTDNAARSFSFAQNGMAHASELIEEVGELGMRYAEEPIRIEYTEYSLRKGQSTVGSIFILLDLIVGRMRKR